MTETLSLDFFGYDLNEPDIVALLEKMGGRLRAIIDNSGSHALPPARNRKRRNGWHVRRHSNVKRMHF